MLRTPEEIICRVRKCRRRNFRLYLIDLAPRFSL